MVHMLGVDCGATTAIHMLHVSHSSLDLHVRPTPLLLSFDPMWYDHAMHVRDSYTETCCYRSLYQQYL